ncbi:photosystem II complex extrinsic protein PsbU [Arthrospira platensis]|jgi:photosystem II PsbU protein|uniref:Photosystem II extrinsic protein U n=1 Tax=Limnospira platensis NIES-46 TaxID=1236695 RepID=A0A5M3TAB7_LIMPL|nr:photosystem II complex extrinsic protein PsbU [Arthrospira platensis]AMW27350.1 Photosystem II extrinsic protein [Arthrospira platensis YZ]MBD2668499.1 photosystem II complex extrinsic protein PsbU [Arthrospira platensis FACHB-439]MBD2710696.1 photosystem II complex extrinsic protein PsbU [Arthrospira platensis FACHB-835]MDF2211101.1 photosystem II complex extrinsic protein PsbU [Arthrospira platensis NCB002]MDT9181638.1 photosystem II complex extrinsic protein PsbU [Limnospira sp. PMC 289.
MKRLGQVLALVGLLVGLLGWSAPQSAWAADLSFVQLPSLPAPVLAEVNRRNKADAKLGTEFGKKLDLNNSSIREFRQYPGMFPTLAKMIIDAAPYDSVQEVLEIPGLTDAQKEIIERYIGEFTITPVEPILQEGDFRLNTGVYD